MAQSTTDRHVVLGAGPAGMTLSHTLAQRGLAVRRIDRSSSGIDDRGVVLASADLTDADAAIRATQGASVIYHCVNVPYHLQTAILPGIGANIIAAAEAQGARLVVLDTLYPYGEADGEAITESTPFAATTRKGLMRAELDRGYLRAHEEGRVSVSLGRAADFFGPAVLNSTLGGAFFPAVLTGQPALAFGDITLPHSYSFIGDVAAGLATLGTNPEGDGRIWHLPVAPAVSTAEIHRLVEDILGEPIQIRIMAEPAVVPPFDAQFMDEYAEMFYQHLIPQNVVSTSFEQGFGITPTTLPVALQETITWYRQLLAG